MKKRKRINRFKTNVPGFDDLLKYGIPEGNAVIVEGGPGSGKTALCLHILHEACKAGKKVLYMSFEEPEERLREHMEDFGFDPEIYEHKDVLRIKRFNALDIARSVEALLSEAKKELLIDLHPVLIPKDFTPDLLVVDSLSSISSAFTGEQNRFRIYMEQLFRYLEANKISSFLIREEAHPSHLKNSFSEAGEAISFLSDGIVVIYNVIYSSGKRGRALEILKMRGDDAARKIVEFEIKDKKGIIVYPNKLLKGDYILT
ncbi:MAG: RAD55 family ATPase [Candidatus Woesearchaeota archaeon]